MPAKLAARVRLPEAGRTSKNGPNEFSCRSRGLLCHICPSPVVARSAGAVVGSYLL